MKKHEEKAFDHETWMFIVLMPAEEILDVSKLEELLVLYLILFLQSI